MALISRRIIEQWFCTDDLFIDNTNYSHGRQCFWELFIVMCYLSVSPLLLDTLQGTLSEKAALGLVFFPGPLAALTVGMFIGSFFNSGRG